MRLKILVFFAVLLVYCTPENSKKNNDIEVVADSYDVEYEDSQDIPQYATECHQQRILFCDPTAEEILITIIDACDNDKVIWVDPDGCIPNNSSWECDPSIPDLGEHECFIDDENVIPGTYHKYCIKGILYETPCECPIFEEVCDGFDNNCNGKIDEGQKNACGKCGPVPEEICDAIDNDCDGSTDEDVVEICQTDCGTGFRICLGGNWSACTASEPEEETCNGMDDDCDGAIDEDISCECPVEQLGELIPCQEPPLKCGKGFKQCICVDDDCEQMMLTQCQQLCIYQPSQPCTDEPTEEECNNHDDDCDVLVDEDLTQFCYDGPIETLGVGVCVGGSQVCRSGQWGVIQEGVFFPGECAGQKLPETFDHCNGSDENCDGDVDDGKKLVKTDVLFVIDFSGSMMEEIDAVYSAMNLFSKYYSDEEVLQWGMIGGPTLDYESIVPLSVNSNYLHLFQNISSFTNFQANLPNLTELHGGGSEMLIDALYISIGGDVSDKDWTGDVMGSIPELYEFIIDWRDDAQKLIILWTDEVPQSFLKPTISKQQLIQQVSATPNLTLHVFAPVPINSWNSIAIAGGGQKFELTSDPEEMYIKLLGILNETVCVEL